MLAQRSARAKLNTLFPEDQILRILRIDGLFFCFFLSFCSSSIAACFALVAAASTDAARLSPLLLSQLFLAAVSIVAASVAVPQTTTSPRPLLVVLVLPPLGTP